MLLGHESLQFFQARRDESRINQSGSCNRSIKPIRNGILNLSRARLYRVLILHLDFLGIEVTVQQRLLQFCLVIVKFIIETLKLADRTRYL